MSVLIKILIIFVIAVLTIGSSNRTAEALQVACYSINVAQHSNSSAMISREHSRNKSRKSKKGITTTIYHQQIISSINRCHPPPNYTLLEFREWMYSQPNFEQLFWDWTMSVNDKWLKPSADRLDDYKPYTLDNLRLVTWRMNNTKAYYDMKTGVNTKQSKAVIGIHKKTGEVVKFYSVNEAQRQTGITNHISVCCLQKPRRKSAGGYIWRYADV